VAEGGFGYALLGQTAEFPNWCEMLGWFCRMVPRSEIRYTLLRVLLFFCLEE
jgi:hypothetical protein